MSKGNQGSQPDLRSLDKEGVRNFVKQKLKSGSVAIMPEGQNKAGFYDDDDFKNKKLSLTDSDDTIILFGGNLDHLATPGSGGGGQAKAAGPYSDPEKKGVTFAFPITTVYSKLSGACDLGLQWDKKGGELTAKMLMEAELKMLRLAIAEGAKVVVPTDNQGTPSNPGERSSSIFVSNKVLTGEGNIIARQLIKDELIDKNHTVQSNSNSAEAVKKLREIVRLRRDRLQQLISSNNVDETKEALKKFCVLVNGAESLDDLQSSLQPIEGVIKYQIEDSGKIVIESINPPKQGQDPDDYLNAFDVEFEPIIEYYKNHGEVEFKPDYLSALSDDHAKQYVESQLKRAQDKNSRYASPASNSLESAENSLKEISQQIQSGDFYKQISLPNPDMLKSGHKGEFIRYHRKNPGLEALSCQGGYWYVGGNMSKVMNAYAKESGFKPETFEGSQVKKYTKGEESIFVKEEVLTTGEIDILQELKNIKTEQKNAKIYIPLNYGGGHWTLLEIECIKGRNNKFEFTKNYFNPSGWASVPKEFDKKIDEQIKSVNFEEGLSLFEKVIKKTSVAHQRTKSQTDGSSCGPISCWYFNQRIKGQSCQASENFSSGALDLRKEQLQLVSKHAASDEVYSFVRAGCSINPEKTQSSQNKTAPQEVGSKISEVEKVLNVLEEIRESKEGKSWLFSALYSACREALEADEKVEIDDIKISFTRYPEGTKNKLNYALDTASGNKVDDLKKIIQEFSSEQEKEEENQKKSWEEERKQHAKSTYLNAIFSSDSSSRPEESKIIFRDHFIGEIASLDSFKSKNDNPREVINLMMDVVFPEESKQIHIKKVSHDVNKGSAKLQEDLKGQVDLQELVVDFGKRGRGSEVEVSERLTLEDDASVQLDLTAFFIVEGDKKSAYIKQQNSTWICYGSDGIQDLGADFKIEEDLRKKITFAKYSKENPKVSPYKKSDAAKFTGKYFSLDPEYAFVSSFNPDLMRGGNWLSSGFEEAELTHPALLDSSNKLVQSDAKGVNNLSTLLAQFSSDGLNATNNSIAREGFLIDAQTILNNSVDRYLSALEGYKAEDEKVKELREFLVNSDNSEKSSELISRFESTGLKTIETLFNLKKVTAPDPVSSLTSTSYSRSSSTSPIAHSPSEPATIEVKVKSGNISIKTAENNLVKVFEGSGEKKIQVDEGEFKKAAMAYYLGKEGGVKTGANLEPEKVTKNQKNLAEALTIEKLAARSSNPPRSAFTPISAAQIGATVVRSK